MLFEAEMREPSSTRTPDCEGSAQPHLLALGRAQRSDERLEQVGATIVVEEDAELDAHLSVSV